MRLWRWMRRSKPVPGKQDYEQYGVYSQLLDRNGQWIGIADTKAGVVLGFLIASFPVFAAPALPVAQLLVKSFPSHPSLWADVLVAGFIVLLVVFFAVALMSLLHVLLTLLPRLTRQRKPGLLFFSDIANQEYEHWQRDILALDSQILAAQVLEQVYTTACIADIKHKHVRRAIRFLMATIFIGVMLYVCGLLIS